MRRSRSAASSVGVAGHDGAVGELHDQRRVVRAAIGIDQQPREARQHGRRAEARGQRARHGRRADVVGDVAGELRPAAGRACRSRAAARWRRGRTADQPAAQRALDRLHGSEGRSMSGSGPAPCVTGANYPKRPVDVMFGASFGRHTGAARQWALRTRPALTRARSLRSIGSSPPAAVIRTKDTRDDAQPHPPQSPLSRWPPPAAYWPAAARADFRLCNNLDPRRRRHRLHRRQGWVTEGWWNLKPSDCETLLRGPLAAHFYYVYARTTAAASGAARPSCAPATGNSRSWDARIASPAASTAPASSRSTPARRRTGPSSSPTQPAAGRQ